MKYETASFGASREQVGRDKRVEGLAPNQHPEGLAWVPLAPHRDVHLETVALTQLEQLGQVLRGQAVGLAQNSYRLPAAPIDSSSLEPPARRRSLVKRKQLIQATVGHLVGIEDGTKVE
jgi:hypothetical protein